MGGIFWLNDKQWEKLQPLLPVDTRARRVDDRRIISGIIHVLKSGGRWGDLPKEDGPKKTLYNRYVTLGKARRVARYIHYACCVRRVSGRGSY
jgi:transposase